MASELRFPSDDLIAEAITDFLGERCADFNAYCYTCQAWSQYDDLVGNRAELATLRARVEELEREVNALLSNAAAKGDEPDLLLTEWKEAKARAERAEEAFEIANMRLEATRRAVEAGGTVSELVERLDGFAKAYPESVFPPPTKEDRDWLHETRPGLQDRIAADMGRHFAQFATEAAALLTRQQALLDEAVKVLEPVADVAATISDKRGVPESHISGETWVSLRLRECRAARATITKIKESRDA